MLRTSLFIYFFLGLGLLFVPFLALAQTRAARLIFFWLSLAVINLGVGAVVLAVLAVSRLEGSTPPGLLEALSPLWLPLLLTAGLDAGILLIHQKVKTRWRE